MTGRAAGDHRPRVLPAIDPDTATNTPGDAGAFEVIGGEQTPGYAEQSVLEVEVEAVVVHELH